MANCPNCGSTDIQLKQDSNVNWGRAIAGWVLFGVVGGAVGAVTGKDTTANASCLDCGTVWRAEDLYKLLQYIESLTKVKLSMSVESDRRKVNIFTTDIMPLINKMEIAEKAYKEGLTKNNNNDSLLSALFLAPIAIIWGWTTFSSGNWFLGGISLLFGVILLIGLIGMIFLGKSPEQALQDNLEQNKIKSKQEFDAKLKEFVSNI